MAFERITVVCAGIVLASAAVTAQQSSGGGTSGQTQQGTSTTVTERTPNSTGTQPSRRVQTRRVEGGREVVADTVERPNTDGRLTPREETVTETVGSGPSAQTTQDVFTVDANGRRRLRETTQTTQETAPDGTTRTVRTTRGATVNGVVDLTTRRVEETSTTTTASGAKQTETTELLPNTDNELEESRRTQTTERTVSPGVVRQDSTEMKRDQNGRWEAVEVRSSDTRAVSASEQLQEETIQRQDVNGKLTDSQRNVTRRTTDASGRVTEVTETFGENLEGMTRPATRMGLSQRVTKTTTTTADGGSSTVEEIERRSLGNPNDPMRVTTRTVETVRNVGGRLETTRQVYERDANGRMVLVSTDTQETTKP
jgi:hypothetical protein